MRNNHELQWRWISLLVKISLMIVHTLRARSNISFLEENRRETKTACVNGTGLWVKSNIQAAEEPFDSQFMTGSDWQTDDYQLYEINHYHHTHKSNENNLNTHMETRIQTYTLTLKIPLRAVQKYRHRYGEVNIECWTPLINTHFTGIPHTKQDQGRYFSYRTKQTAWYFWHLQKKLQLFS